MNCYTAVLFNTGVLRWHNDGSIDLFGKKLNCITSHTVRNGRNSLQFQGAFKVIDKSKCVISYGRNTYLNVS